MNLAIILGLITFIGWGTGDIFTIYVSRKIGSSLTTFWVFFSCFLLSLVVLPFAPHSLNGITTPLLFLNLLLGILFISGNVLVSEAFRISSAPLVGIIIQSFPAVVLILSSLIFKDPISSTKWLFILIIFLGVFLCSVDLKSLTKSQKIIDRGVITALVAVVCLSFFFTFSRVLINAYGWFLPTFIANACFPIVYLLIKWKKEKFYMPKLGKVLTAAFVAGGLIRSADFALNWGLTIPNASSIVAPIAGAAPILFVIMSYFIFKDKLTKQQIMGIVTTLVGIILLTTLGS